MASLINRNIDSMLNNGRTQDNSPSNQRFDAMQKYFNDYISAYSNMQAQIYKIQQDYERKHILSSQATQQEINNYILQEKKEVEQKIAKIEEARLSSMSKEELKENAKAVSSREKGRRSQIKTAISLTEDPAEKAKLKAEYKKSAEAEYKAQKAAGFDNKHQEKYLKALVEGNEELAEREKKKADSLEDIKKNVKDFANKWGQDVNRAIALVSQYQAKIDSRLQGTETSYTKMANKISSVLSISPFVKQTEVLSKLSGLVEAGIAYNVEQRAFLASISDSIASSFDSLDATMTRLIRIQQADTTAARLGMEASLTQFFNNMFNDTSYLSSVASGVRSAIVDATSQLSRDDSIAFEYTVQKWLGSLYSIGLSEGTISKIAQGINYLGTGNVQALQSDAGLQTLLALSLVGTGYDYASILTEGLNEYSTNEIFKSMVSYLRTIAQNPNKVVKSAYGSILGGMTPSDLTVLASLSDADIASISGNRSDYYSSMGEMQRQLLQLPTRLTMATMISNISDNFKYTLGAGIANNPVLSALWTITDLIESNTGGIHIPNPTAIGTGLGLHSFTIEGLVKTALVGVSTLGMISDFVNAIQGGFGLSLDTWEASEYNKRGAGFISGRGANRSKSAIYASASSSDISQSSMYEASSKGDEDLESIQSQKSKPQEKGISTTVIHPALLSPDEGGSEDASIQVKVVQIMDEKIEKMMNTLVALLEYLKSDKTIFKTNNEESIKTAFGLTDGDEEGSSTLQTLINDVTNMIENPGIIGEDGNPLYGGSSYSTASGLPLGWQYLVKGSGTGVG